MIFVHLYKDNFDDNFGCFSYYWSITMKRKKGRERITTSCEYERESCHSCTNIISLKKNILSSSHIKWHSWPYHIYQCTILILNNFTNLLEKIIKIWYYLSLYINRKIRSKQVKSILHIFKQVIYCMTEWVL